MHPRNKGSGIWQRAKGFIDRAQEQIRFLKYEKDFGERDSDIYVVSFPRSGTTLLQVIAYHLTHDGGVIYPHLDNVSPWLRNLAMKKLPIPKVPEPRVIKTHDPYSLFPPDKKGRFIFVIRNPADVVVSNFYNWKNYNDPDLKLDEVFDKLIKTDSASGYFNFNQTWLENKKGFPIVYLRYEDILADKEAGIEKIASFLNVQITRDKMDELLQLSSFDFMKHNEEKFGEKWKEDRPGVMCNQFIRRGTPGEGETMLNEEQRTFSKIEFDKLINGSGKMQ